MWNQQLAILLIIKISVNKINLQNQLASQVLSVIDSNLSMRLLKQKQQKAIKLTKQQNDKVLEEIKLIHYRILNSAKSSQSQMQGFKCEVISPYTKNRVSEPVTNSGCKSKRCIWQLQDILELLKKQIQNNKKKGNTTPLQTYECPLCSNGYFKNILKVANFYVNRDLQLALRVAKQKFFQDKVDDKTNNRIFDASQLQFHKNGKVQLHYQVVKQKIKVEEKLTILLPSLLKIDENINYNPSEYILNKDEIKIVHRVLQKLIINKCKNAFNSLQLYSGAQQVVQKCIQSFSNSMQEIYQKNTKVQQDKGGQIAFKFVKCYSSASIELLTYYPRFKSQNYFSIKHKNSRFNDINTYSQALIHENVIYIVSQKIVYYLDLRNIYSGKKFVPKIQEQTIVARQLCGIPCYQPKTKNSQEQLKKMAQHAQNPQTIKYKEQQSKQGRLLNAALVIAKDYIYWFGGQFINQKQQSKLVGESWKFALCNNCKGWQFMETIPQQCRTIQSTVVYDDKNSCIYLIGGYKANKSKSSHIIEYSIESNCFKILENAIKVKHYDSKCIVTRSLNQNIFMLFDAKVNENSQTQPNYVKVFNTNNKKIEQQFIVQNIYARSSDIRNQIIFFTPLPAMPAYYQGINYFWARGLNSWNTNKSVLVYGTDDAWCVSEVNQI